jgi:hypothetical protein
VTTKLQSRYGFNKLQQRTLCLFLSIHGTTAVRHGKRPSPNSWTRVFPNSTSSFTSARARPELSHVQAMQFTWSLKSINGTRTCWSDWGFREHWFSKGPLAILVRHGPEPLPRKHTSNASPSKSSNKCDGYRSPVN